MALYKCDYYYEDYPMYVGRPLGPRFTVELYFQPISNLTDGQAVPRKKYYQ